MAHYLEEDNGVDPSNGSEAGPTYGYPNNLDEGSNMENSDPNFGSDDYDESSILSCLEETGMEFAEYCDLDDGVDESYPASLDSETENKYTDITVESSDIEASETLSDGEGTNNFFEAWFFKYGDSDKESDNPAGSEYILSEEDCDMDSDSADMGYSVNVSDGEFDHPASPEYISREYGSNIDSDYVENDHPANVSDVEYSDTKIYMETMPEKSPGIANQLDADLICAKCKRPGTRPWIVLLTLIRAMCVKRNLVGLEFYAPTRTQYACSSVE
ncbi:hypothetical protein BJ085DRAFT_28649 [Dimargaris cristalligena]|uniref:Uncharacterized protein n=1 Tax=Dimargaris cristalligena TaxID=215637 RepID=A0A4P9ZS63_9FUNG|nr:hypothetical protein BJ085DRAFT_28649 [Dimargaris cristalligena]|eukprot:RKP35522.1 hypothetical protein BJ085DRAFT_28649 [Dimargaris cristalligena]